MKKILFSMFAGAGILAVSCSNNDDDDAAVNYAQEIAATYSGYTDATTAYFTGMVTENQTVRVSANGDGTVNVGFDSDTWGKTAIDNAVVKPTEGGYVISGTGESVISGHGGTKSYACTLAGKVGTAKNNVVFEFSIPSVMGGLTVKFIQGTAPASLVVNGTYEGYTSTSTAYFQGMISVDESVKIVAEGDDTVSVEYKSATWGEATINAATVKREASGFKISGNGTLAMPGMNGGETKNYDCAVSGTISLSKDNVEITFSIPSVMGGTNIKFSLGEAPVTE